MKKLTGSPWLGGKPVVAVVGESTPNHVATTPITLDHTNAAGRLLVSRSDVAAGPMSSAVESIEPMAIDESATAIASARMKRRPNELECECRARPRGPD